MLRKTIILSVIMLMFISMMVTSVGVSYAQGGGGNGRGNGHGGPHLDDDDDDANTPPYGMGNGRNSSRNGSRNGYGMNGQTGPGQFRNGPCLACLPPAVEGELPDDVAAAMLAGLMDEYHAYAIYQAVIDQFGEVAPFVNIQAAEAQHIAAHEFMFERYELDIPEPIVLVPAPVFDSLQDACQTAVDAEIANMNLYDEWLVTVQNYPDLVQVFSSLRNASEFNHLPAFERCASR
jgi:hypothetical protein